MSRTRKQKHTNMTVKETTFDELKPEELAQLSGSVARHDLLYLSPVLDRTGSWSIRRANRELYWTGPELNTWERENYLTWTGSKTDAQKFIDLLRNEQPGGRAIMDKPAAGLVTSDHKGTGLGTGLGSAIGGGSSSFEDWRTKWHIKDGITVPKCDYKELPEGVVKDDYSWVQDLFDQLEQPDLGLLFTVVLRRATALASTGDFFKAKSWANDEDGELEARHAALNAALLDLHLFNIPVELQKELDKKTNNSAVPPVLSSSGKDIGEAVAGTNQEAKHSK